jgi:phage terminase large subunit
MLDVRAQFPHKLEFLFQAAPYKVAYGGRGAAKSWGFARALLLIGARKKVRILCAREKQNSIAESVLELLSNQIPLLGLSDAYEVTSDGIYGHLGTEFMFRGLQGNKQNVRNVKSTEGLDVIWVEEADQISKHSWDTVIPTLRKPGAELWLTFNPNLASDETYKRFVLHPPPNAIVVEMSWRDNPWFSSRNENDRAHMEQTDPDTYLNVWEGKCRAALEGAVFAKELRQATIDGRICRVRYDPRSQVHTFWDLGWHDQTAIWCVQKVGHEYHLIDYLEDNQTDVAEFIRRLDEKRYTYGFHHLPHDGAAKQQAAKGISIARQVRDMKRRVRILPRLAPATQISYARQLFRLCVIDEERCADGLERLRRFTYKIDDDTGQRDRLPLHDINSHGASAFMGFAVSVKHIDKKPKRTDDDEDAEAETVRNKLEHPEFGPFVHEGSMNQGWMK